MSENEAQLRARITELEQRVEQAEADAALQERNFWAVVRERDGYQQAWKYEQRRHAGPGGQQ